MSEFSAEKIEELEEFGNVLTPRLVELGEPGAFGREAEVELVMHHFDHARFNSVLLVGPSGCGKSAIVKDVVRRLGTRREPWLVLETSCATLMSGTKYLGEWESRVHNMMRAAQQRERIAVYFTDVSNLLSAGKASDTNNNFAAAMMPALERRELVILGECTDEVYRQCIAPRPSFSKFFGMLRIAPQTAEEARKVLQQIVQQQGRLLQRELGVEMHWDDAATAAAAQLGKTYFPGYSPPGGAARLVDHVVSTKRADLERMTRRPASVAVTAQDCIASLEAFTGIPRLLLDDAQRLDLEEVRSYFRARIIGQDEAVDAVVDLITLIKAGLNDPDKPLGVLFFVGPTGVGKTEMAKALAEFIFGAADRMIRYDMSEFKDFNSFEKLIGNPQGNSDRAQSGSLLNRIREQPFSLLLLDEIEKAHANIYDLLLQLFDDGRLSDSWGQAADFTQTIVILTSNLGSEVSEGAGFGFGQEAPRLEDVVTEAMKSFFRPELINRIDRIVHFRPLTKDHVRVLAQRELGEVLMRSGILRRQLRVDVDRGVIDILADAGFHPAYGARPLKRAVERLALVPIAREIVGITDENRPSLVRLLPAGKRIALQLVHDKPAQGGEPATRGVRIVHPLDGKTTKESLGDVRQRLVRLHGQIEELARECEARELARQKSELVARTGRVDFWDDTAAARETMGELYRLEQTLEAVERARTHAARMAERAERLGRGATDASIRKLGEELMLAAVDAETLMYSIRCSDPIDRCHAFVAVTAVEALEEDLVGRLADMYLNWAHQKGFRARIVNEEMQASEGPSAEVTKQLVLLVEGVAIYGLLCAEQGVHAFVSQKTSKSPRRDWFVSVHVMPVFEDSDARRRFTVETKALKGTGRRCRRYKSQSTAVDPSGRRVSIRSGLAPEDAGEVAAELLAAEQWRQEHAATDGAASIVRRYVLSPTQSAKDLRTGTTTNRLDRLFDGALDRFLQAGLDARQGRQARRGDS